MKLHPNDIHSPEVAKEELAAGLKPVYFQRNCVLNLCNEAGEYIGAVVYWQADGSDEMRMERYPSRAEAEAAVAEASATQTVQRTVARGTH